MEAHLLVHPFLPGDLRIDDVPVFIDGTVTQEGRFSRNACLNSPAVFEYALALMVDLLDHYPDLDGLMPDWVEFGAYRLNDIFTCFCPHCAAEALRSGFDWEAMRGSVYEAWTWLHELTDPKLEMLKDSYGNVLVDFVANRPGLQEFVRFKAHTVKRFYKAVRELLILRGRGDLLLTSRGWPPPWNKMSGMAYGELALICRVAAPKLFTFDYCALPRWYGEL